MTSLKQKKAGFVSLGLRKSALPLFHYSSCLVSLAKRLALPLSLSLSEELGNIPFSIFTFTVRYLFSFFNIAL